MLKNTDHAWAAGIIDGEGTICMTVCKPGVNGRKTTGFQIRISVRMTCEKTIRRLYDMYGGTFKLSLPQNPAKHRICYEWYVGDLRTIEVLCCLLPYLVTKHSQAELVMEYRRECYPEGHRGRGHPCDESLTGKRFEFFHRLKELNQKGPR